MLLLGIVLLDHLILNCMELVTSLKKMTARRVEYIDETNDPQQYSRSESLSKSEEKETFTVIKIKPDHNKNNMFVSFDASMDIDKNKKVL